MHTEEEAKKLWCPMARLPWNTYEQQFTVNNFIPETSRAICIASSCSMWRWERLVNGLMADTGFCGLAGKP